MKRTAAIPYSLALAAGSGSRKGGSGLATHRPDGWAYAYAAPISRPEVDEEKMVVMILSYLAWGRGEAFYNTSLWHFA